MKKIICVFLMFALGCSLLAGCTAKSRAVNLMADISAKAAEPEEISLFQYGRELNEFALKLFNECRTADQNKKNTLISPLSVVLALSMTANGADGETLSQMENTLGLSKDELNRFAYFYRKLLSERTANMGKLKLANSIWFTSNERFAVDRSFLQVNADYYGAEIYKAPFDDTTVKDINDWVSDKTDKMIPEILETIPDEAVMYLANALAFDAEWAEKYFDYQVYDDDFTTSDGRKETKKYLHGKENIYIEDENATGFMKYYKGYKYAFVALLPNEGIDVDSYLDKVDGAHLSDMLENKRTCAVYTSIPKFNIDYGVEMKEILKEMGMSLAFDQGTADFSKLGHSTGGNIFINRVMHKTFIAVDENGTKAGAATIVEMTDGAAPIMEEPKEVYLTRSFVYMLIDCQTNSPFFIGVMRDLEG